MSTVSRLAPELKAEGIEIRVRGRVQGVGFRPMVWRQARELGLRGVVFNDADGLLIRAGGSTASVHELVERIKSNPPPMASVDSVECAPFEGELPSSFEIAASIIGPTNTAIAPDTAMCSECAHDVFDPFSRRYRYPFTTCTNCGPRLTIVARMPYDRLTTSMAAFDLCKTCAGEYGDPNDRRFHAETTACHACGPKARLIRFDGKAFSFEQSSMLDDVDAALGLIQKGEIVAIKGLGGYQLACDATKADTVARLRRLKHRDRKPFALMARDLEIIRRYCAVSPEEEDLLKGPIAPIVLLTASGATQLSNHVAPNLNRLGFMLPSTPLHALLLRRMNRPVVMTSGNLSGAPQVITDGEAKAQLGSIAPYALIHDRDIRNRVDDSVVKVSAGSVRVLRRARGYAPSSLRLPAGFETSPEILALGGDLKSAFCFTKAGAAVLSHHIGDLDDAATLNDFERALVLYRDLLGAAPSAIVCDLHPGYRSAIAASKMAQTLKRPVIKVQHHHAHIASCMAENGRALDAADVLGIALDGLGYGDHGEIWGGEFLLASYGSYERLATFKPVAMLGGDQASREPWRNLYAHLMAEMGWSAFSMNFADLDVFKALESKPRKILNTMLSDGINAPKASSCGRLFDAAAAAIGLCFELQGYEGEAAASLEAVADPAALQSQDGTLDYPFTIPRLKGSNLPYIEPLAAWNALLGDLILKAPPGVMSARFHRGLARAISAMAVKLARRDRDVGARFDTVALSGGCFHNSILLDQVASRLRAQGFDVLTQAEVPSGDGGLALGQAAIAAAQMRSKRHGNDFGGDPTCASASPEGS